MIAALAGGTLGVLAGGVGLDGRGAFAHPWFGYEGKRNGDTWRGAPPTGYESGGMTLRSWIPLNEFPGVQTSAADIWGYTSGTGREYAIIGLQDITAFVEITDPSEPVLVATVAGPRNLWHDATVIGDWAYLSSEGGSGIQVVDLRQIDSGIVTHVQDKTQSGHWSTHTILSNPQSGYLYLCGANIAGGGLVIANTTNPSNPIITGSWGQRYVHEAYITSYTSGPYAGKELAYCFSAGAGLDVIDVTNKAAPFRIGGTGYSGLRYCHQGWMTDDKRYLYVNDELDEGSSVNSTRTLVFDVSNPASPTLVKTFGNGGRSTDHNNYVVGNRLFQSNYTSGIRVWDIASPLNPVEIGHVDTYPPHDEVGYHGSWGNYPFFPSGIIAVSDIERGLFVVEMGTYRVDFAFPDGRPTNIGAEGEEVRVLLSETNTTVDSSSVMLHMRSPQTGGGEVAVAMTNTGGLEYRAVLGGSQISGLECYDEVEFWITAKDLDGRKFQSPWDAPRTGVWSTDVADSYEDELVDSFEMDLGWTASGIDLTGGAWERGVPQGGQGAPTQDGDGSGKCYVTGLAPSNDVDGTAILTSPRLELGAGGHARLDFWWWHSTSLSVSGRGTLEVSRDDGATWTEVMELPSTDGAWEGIGVRLGDDEPLTDQTRVRFVVPDVSTVARVEAGLDGVVISRMVCSACRADWNEDGTIDAFDYDDFVSEYFGYVNSGTGFPDYNGDGSVDAFDYDDFVSEYFAGC